MVGPGTSWGIWVACVSRQILWRERENAWVLVCSCSTDHIRKIKERDPRPILLGQVSRHENEDQSSSSSSSSPESSEKTADGRLTERRMEVATTVREREGGRTGVGDGCLEWVNDHHRGVRRGGGVGVVWEKARRIWGVTPALYADTRPEHIDQ